MPDNTEHIIELKESMGGLEATLNSVQTEVKQINKHLLGNGRAGLLERQTRMEENLDELTKVVQELAGSQKELAASVAKLTETVQTHVVDKDKHDFKTMLLQKDNIKYLILLIVFVIGVYKGEDITTIVRTWLGL